VIDLWLAQLKVCAETGKPQTFEYQRWFDRGDRHLAVTIGFIGRSREGHSRFSYTAIDVTEQRRLERSFLENEQRLRLAQDFAHIGTWEFNFAERKMEWSATMKTIFNLRDRAAPRDEEEFFALIHPADQAALRANLRDCMEKKTDHHAEFRVLDPDGKVRWIEGRGHVVYDSQDRSQRMLGVAIDITDRKRAEEIIREKSAQLQTLSKLSSLGEMAGGMAHEINNPLTIVLGSAAILQRELRAARLSRPKLEKAVGNIVATGSRISKIIEGLRFFARDGSLDPFEQASLAAIFDDTLALCGERMKKQGVALLVPRVPAGLKIECRPVQIAQVILNLLNNAFDAVTPLTGEKCIRLTAREEGTLVAITVSDNGIGLPTELESKIFEPFFTTKPPGSGTGLGLSISKGIAESHGGSLSYARGAEGESNFCLRLPKAQKRQDQEKR
jgi:PAS domain S-box-containing protein